MKATGYLLFGGIVAVGYWASQAQALPQFKKAFEEKYVTNSTNDDFKATFEKESCNVCHVKGKERTIRNEYGKALEKFTGGNVRLAIKAAGGVAAQKAVLRQVLKTLDDAFDKLEKEPSPSGETFGARIKASKLPN